MKSYKDFPKDVIMNAPDGAMWVTFYGYSGDPSYAYYKYESENGLHVAYPRDIGVWHKCVNTSFSELQEDPQTIPLPNVKIPWEATEDRECPFPCLTLVDVDLEYPDELHGGGCKNLLAGELGWNHNGCIYDGTITSYKIIDPEYANSRDSLVQKLKFLQNLGKEFPELQEETLTMMKKELYDYWDEMV